MKKTLIFAGAILLAAMLASCTGPRRYHEKPLEDPSEYAAHFPEMDRNGDGLVSREEFDTRFPDANTDVFQALDQNKDGGIDHHEWHNFRKAHCIKDHHNCCMKDCGNLEKDHHEHQ